MALLNYKLDPAFYITSPHFSFDAMLRKTWGKLELISDPAMFEMIDGGIRGGVAVITTRYARANNEGTGERYDATNLPLQSRDWTRTISADGPCLNPYQMGSSRGSQSQR